MPIINHVNIGLKTKEKLQPIANSLRSLKLDILQSEIHRLRL